MQDMPNEFVDPKFDVPDFDDYEIAPSAAHLAWEAQAETFAEPILVDRYSRSELSKLTSDIDAHQASLFGYIDDTEEAAPPCIVNVVSTKSVRSVLKPHWEQTGIDAALVSETTLVFYLPPEFELCLTSFVQQDPDIFNDEDLDLRCNTTYLGWTLKLPGDAVPTQIWVQESALCEALSSAFGYPEREGGWLPVIALAGDTVAVCGFVVDEGFIGCAQASSMNAGDTRPEAIYTADELATAAQEAARVGLRPWYEGRWAMTTWDGVGQKLVLGATGYVTEDAN